MFDVKDQESKALSDFQVYIDGTEVEDDKKTYVFGSKFKYVVKKLGYGDSTEKEHTVVDEEPNKIEVQLERTAKVSKYVLFLSIRYSTNVFFSVSTCHHCASKNCQVIH